MNKQTEDALKLAIEAMSCISQSRGDPLLKAIRACKEALAELKEANYWLKNNPRTDIIEAYENKINSLESHINILRDALEVCKYDCHTGEVIGVAQQALAKTTPQSLQEHDNEVIEMCAKVCESLENEDTGYVWIPDARGALHTTAKAIRAMKGKQND